MTIRTPGITVPVLGLLLLAGCRAPALLPEGVQAELKSAELRAAGAEVYLPSAYQAFRADLVRALAAGEREQRRFFLVRNLGPVRAELSALVRRGDALLAAIQEQRAAHAGTLPVRLERLGEELRQVERLAGLLNEGRTARRNLTHAATLLAEARRHAAGGDHAQAEARLARAEALADAALAALRPLLARFTDPENLARWRGWVDETIRESARTGRHAIVVSKVERRLTLYHGGRPERTFEVALGANGFSDKRMAGDRATPEGRYHVVQKKAASRFFRALLINYPNLEDLERFREDKRRGLIADRAGVGGLIEIHGGGVAGMTYGCIALENGPMQQLFSLVNVGTPVTIVGALDGDNVVARTLRAHAAAK
ncbi:MAG: murein L,D-transpeptidase family protein [Candidatus Methylomirabilales bacterium]